MKILTFDTSLDKTYVTLSDNDSILANEIIENHNEKYHSAFLMPTIVSILKENNLFVQDIDAIATNIGPGSFTGIRACVTVARVMAQQLNCKAVGVSSLEILAKLADTPLIALDARKNSAYLYHDNEIKGAVLLDEIQDIIKNGNYTVITDDKLQPILGGKSYQQENLPLGEILAQLGEEKLNNLQNSDWRTLKPLYIQPPPMG